MKGCCSLDYSKSPDSLKAKNRGHCLQKMLEVHTGVAVDEKLVAPQSGEFMAKTSNLLQYHKEWRDLKAVLATRERQKTMEGLKGGVSDQGTRKNPTSPEG